MSTRVDVLQWAQHVIARKHGPAHELLEVRPDVTAQQAQAAFHKIARTAHPDLHRHDLTPEELELVTSAYAAVAGAYQELRNGAQAPRTRPMTRDVVPPNASAPATPSSSAPGSNAAQQMSPKALVYFRKAELCLRRGDLTGAILQLKLACASDPSSSFLRTALAEVETEVRKTP